MTNEQFLVVLGKIIKEKRTALSKSQEEFSEAVGLHRTYIGSIERGERNLSVMSLYSIASALGTAPSELLIEAERQVGDRALQSKKALPADGLSVLL